MEDNQDNQVPNPQLSLEEEEAESSSPTRSIKWFIIGGILIVFLAAAAFLGARLLKPPGDAAAQGSGGMFFTSKGGPSGGQKSMRVDMTPASELPQTPTATRGLFVRRQDQSIFVGTGNVRMLAKPSSGSDQPDVSANYDGPVVEVVINHETKVYQDITDMTPPDSAANGATVTIQQVVKPGSLDDLGKNSMISVWGDKQGDRYIAKVVVFR